MQLHRRRNRHSRACVLQVKIAATMKLKCVLRSAALMRLHQQSVLRCAACCRQQPLPHGIEKLAVRCAHLQLASGPQNCSRCNVKHLLSRRAPINSSVDTCAGKQALVQPL